MKTAVVVLAASVAVYAMSLNSEPKLRGVHPKLVEVVKLARKYSKVKFVVGDGKRTRAQQRIYVQRGVSKTMRSKHLTGHAVDLWVLDSKGKVTWKWAPYEELNKGVQKAAKELGIKVTWGGSWKTFKDGPHFQINPKEYP